MCGAEVYLGGERGTERGGKDAIGWRRGELGVETDKMGGEMGRVDVDGERIAGAGDEPACSRTLRRSSGLPIIIPMAPLR